MSKYDRKYIIFNVSELSTLDFSQVLETSVDTINYNIAGTQTVVKYVGDMPSSIQALTTKEGPYTHSEIITILDGPTWNDPNDVI
jgi:hypothetical protein